ncbi:hypothetical protein AYR66_12105 [Noviherbaspirillum denitrificans]|uniref:Uncharacterized protein n=1 Tax=Noviherbaspirillum denitrificans TaxID=1968433 RepID=A0A254TBU0_9BURK|nr:hypothetical protein AYR66_12105 [Noviherbaspirillum denitrificans]
MPDVVLRAAVDEVTKEMVDFIKTIDNQIDWIDGVLEFAQPLHTGAIRIEWRTMKKSVLRMPRIVEWRRQKTTGIWSYKDVKNTHLSLKAKFNGDFLEHHHRVVECLSDLDFLLKVRKRAVEMLRLYRLHSRLLMSKNADAIFDVTIRMMEHNVALKSTREERARWLRENPPETRVKKTKRRGAKGGDTTKPEFIETVTLIDEADDIDDNDDDQT